MKGFRWFLALRPRHRAIAVCLALAAALFAAVAVAADGAEAAGAGGGPATTACHGVPRAPSVRWFLSNPRALDCVLAECEDNPGLFARTPACVTGQSAAFARLRDRYAGESDHRRAWPPAAPAAPGTPPGSPRDPRWEPGPRRPELPVARRRDL